MCWTLDIKVVSAFVFSIDNFKRPQEDVDGLLLFIGQGLLELCSYGCVGQIFSTRSGVEKPSDAEASCTKYG
jgi:ditrans,polycis-polyprenyl diphosphate synthase